MSVELTYLLFHIIFGLFVLIVRLFSFSVFLMFIPSWGVGEVYPSGVEQAMAFLFVRILRPEACQELSMHKHFLPGFSGQQCPGI